MRIGHLKIFSSIKKNMCDIKWRSITDAELDKALLEPQRVSSCYSDSALQSIASTKTGRNILKSRIKIQTNASADYAYKFTFTVNGKNEIYRVNPSDYWGKYFKITKRFVEDEKYPGNFHEPNDKNFNIAYNIAISKLIEKHPTQKGILYRICKFPFRQALKCEFNKPSRAFEWLTGIKPDVLFESGLKKLKNSPDEVRSLLNRIANSEESGFILLTGAKKVQTIPSWHCLKILKVIPQQNKVTLFDNRFQKTYTYTYDDIISYFKSIVGIDWSKVNK